MALTAGPLPVGFLETTVRPSPLLSAAAAAALLAAVAGPATAATEPVPAKGVASSTVTLLGVAAGGHTVSAGTLELLSDMLGAESVAKILLTPLTTDGTAHGQQTVTPDRSPVSAPVLSTSALAPALNGLIGVTSPVLNASSSNDDGEPSTSAGATSLGGLNVLGLPVALNGTLDVASAVSRVDGAVGNQQLLVEDVALPSVADLLAALGLDLKALPIDVLNELLSELGLVNTVVTTANKALTDATAGIQTQVDAAQAAVDSAAAQLAAETAKLAPATAALAPLETTLLEKNAALAAANTASASAAAAVTKAQQDVAAATAEVNRLTLLGPLGAALLPAAQALLTTVNTTLASATSTATTAAAAVTSAQSAAQLAKAAVDAARGVVATIQTAINGLQATLDAAVNALKSLLTNVQPLIDQLLGAITAVLDGTPLVSFESLELLTAATASSNKEGGQSAKVVGGELVGLNVLGTDVLDDVLGTSSVDLLDLTGSTLAQVNGLIAELTGTLSSVLSTVPQFPTLSIPAPQVGLLTKSSSTSITDGFGVANTAIKGLSITLPSVSIPTALALPGAAQLPALAGITQVAGLLTSAPVKMDMATMTSNSRFAPAVTAAPTTPGTGTPGTGTPGTDTPGTGTPGVAAPQLPRTGASQALAVLGVALMAAAVVARRRQTEDTAV
ncbi:MAG: hypothetical protein JWM62_686 [Frankiales bacterium]|nr:hypothetical protein [Frankiales bacterium]